MFFIFSLYRFPKMNCHYCSFNLQVSCTVCVCICQRIKVYHSHTGRRVYTPVFSLLSHMPLFSHFFVFITVPLYVTLPPCSIFCLCFSNFQTTLLSSLYSHFLLSCLSLFVILNIFSFLLPPLFFLPLLSSTFPGFPQLPLPFYVSLTLNAISPFSM